MQILPPDAVWKLRQAGEIKDEKERRKAVDDAIDFVKQKYPNYFVQEEEIQHETHKRKTSIPRFIRSKNR